MTDKQQLLARADNFLRCTKDAENEFDLIRDLAAALSDTTDRVADALAHTMSNLNAMMTCFGMDAESPTEKLVMKGAQEAWEFGMAALKSQPLNSDRVGWEDMSKVKPDLPLGKSSDDFWGYSKSLGKVIELSIYHARYAWEFSNGDDRDYTNVPSELPDDDITHWMPKQDRPAPPVSQKGE